MRLMLGDCLDWMKEIESGSVDCIITDPPYPEIDRPYGRMTEADWHVMMRGVVEESRRVLKPRGSAVFILQPNSERVGRMRPWLWEFMAWTAKEWNQVQDAWWWNISALPTGGAITGGLLRSSVKPCVWLGPEDCYRSQEDVLWSESDENATRRKADKVDRFKATIYPSGQSVNRDRCRSATVNRGGTTPFNLLPIRGSTAKQSSQSEGHPATTPADVADWWTRYICPPGGVICDPFMGSGTMGLAALNRGRLFIGIEKILDYFTTATVRIAEAENAMPLLDSGSR